MSMKVNPDDIKNDVVLDKYTIKEFIDTCNSLDELHSQIFQGYIAENTGKAESWCEHLYCEFVLAYLQLATNQLLELHNINNNKEE